MIENSNQLRVTEKWRDEFEAVLKKLPTIAPDGHNAILYKAQRDSIESMLIELNDQINQYFNETLMMENVNGAQVGPFYIEIEEFNDYHHHHNDPYEWFEVHLYPIEETVGYWSITINDGIPTKRYDDDSIDPKIMHKGLLWTIENAINTCKDLGVWQE